MPRACNGNAYPRSPKKAGWGGRNARQPRGHRSGSGLHSILLSIPGAAPGPGLQRATGEASPSRNTRRRHARKGAPFVHDPGETCENQLLLSHAPLGSTCRVASLSATGLCRRRLLDVGLVPGARVIPVRRSPAGDPTAYNVKGTLIALRGHEAGQVRVEILPQSAPGPAGRSTTRLSTRPSPAERAPDRS
ncbi:MAG: FeoA family protein [Clostridia bacterium]